MMMNIKVEENKLIVGKHSWMIELKLSKKLNRAVKGVTQKHPKEDCVLINEGKEGKGKTNTSIVEGAYLKGKTGRDVHIFFRLEAMVEFAKKTQGKIIIWDEPSLDSLSTDHLNKMNRDLTRLFMTVRKKRHIFLLNYTRFWKFPEYLIVDRADGLIHMRENKIGRFQYIRKKNLEKLWNEKKKSNKRSYKKFMAFGGSIPDIMEKCFEELGFYVNDIANATLEDYEREKDISINSIGQEKPRTKTDLKWEHKLLSLRKKIAVIDKISNLSQADLANHLGVNTGRLREWRKIEIPEL